MKLKAFSIRDTKAEVFNTPFFLKTHGEAERSFKNLLNDQQSMVSKYPEDYDLYYIGDYDQDSGQLGALDTPQHIVKAVQLMGTITDLPTSKMQ